MTALEAGELDLAGHIAAIPDHPSPGVTFRDITPLLADPACFRAAVDRLAAWAAPRQPEVIAAVDARGFVLGGALAAALGCGFVPLRKRDKLPRQRLAVTFDSEYSTETLEVHADAFAPGTRVLVHDDLIAVGACARGCVDLLQRLGGVVVGLCFLIELTQLGGRARVGGHDVFSVVAF